MTFCTAINEEDLSRGEQAFPMLVCDSRFCLPA
jgi:hypothetical protein